MDTHELLLDPGSRLVHIGPHKTGTTSVQTAFHSARSWLHDYGVVYAGPREQPILAALAVAGGEGMRGQRPPREEDWTALVDEVRNAGDQRVVVSSEFFCYADEAAARRVVTELDDGRVHVVITLRPLARIAPSQWQQYVQNGLSTPYVEWLDRMFRKPPYRMPTPSFWRRHRQGDLVRRWAGVAGAENVTVIVVDESDPGTLLRTFEGLVGLPEASLVPTKDAENRSLTRGEIELVRELNDAFDEHGWSHHAHGVFVRLGAARGMKTGRRPPPGEERLRMPKWALEGAAEVGADAVEAIMSSGVRVIGDVSTLAATCIDDVADEDELTETPQLPSDAAALAVLGTLLAAVPEMRLAEDEANGGTEARAAGPRAVEKRLVGATTTADLLRTVARRGRAKFRRALRRR